MRSEKKPNKNGELLVINGQVVVNGKATILLEEYPGLDTISAWETQFNGIAYATIAPAQENNPSKTHYALIIKDCKVDENGKETKRGSGQRTLF